MSVRAMKRLRAGPLTLNLDGDVFRHVKVNGTEAIGAIAFTHDLHGTETSPWTLEHVKVGQGPKGFLVRFDAVSGHADMALRCSVEVKGLSNGTLVFQAVGKTEADLDACGMGFVIAYPSSSLVDRYVQFEALDGLKGRDVFPEVINPDHPFRGLQALTYEVLPGVDITCRMAGGGFDVEDLRNGGVPCFLARPSKLLSLRAGDSFEQSVTISLSGSMSTAVGGSERR
jgi:hypothetical protein